MDRTSNERGPSLAETIRRHQEADRLDLHVTMPAKITSWDAGKQRAQCKILLKNAYLDEENARQVESFPIVSGVPVEFLSAGGFRLTCPISDGNLVIDGATIPATLGRLVFMDRSIDKWLTGSGAEVDPQIDHSHAISDAVFVPGLHTFGTPLRSCPTDHMTIGADQGVQIHLRNKIITVGDEAGSDFIALAAKVKAWMDAFKTAVSSWVVAPNDGGAAFRVLLTAPPFSTTSTNVAATQGKTK